MEEEVHIKHRAPRHTHFDGEIIYVLEEARENTRSR
jgi:hypothetical protein